MTTPDNTVEAAAPVAPVLNLRDAKREQAAAKGRRPAGSKKAAPAKEGTGEGAR